jgi:hypothetical protein
MALASICVSETVSPHKHCERFPMSRALRFRPECDVLVFLFIDEGGSGAKSEDIDCAGVPLVQGLSTATR